MGHRRQIERMSADVELEMGRCCPEMARGDVLAFACLRRNDLYPFEVRVW